MIINLLVKRNQFLEWITKMNLEISMEFQMKILFHIYTQSLLEKWRFFNAQIWWNTVLFKKIPWIDCSIKIVRNNPNLLNYNKNFLKLVKSLSPSSNLFSKVMEIPQTTSSSTFSPKSTTDHQKASLTATSPSTSVASPRNKLTTLPNSCLTSFLYKWISESQLKVWVRCDSNQRRTMTQIKWKPDYFKC